MLLLQVKNVLPTGDPMLNMVTNIIVIAVASIFGGGYIWKLFRERQANIAELKKNHLENEAIQKMEELTHDNGLEFEKFNFDREKYVKREENNETFQKDIINRVFEKFVVQTEWITKMYESKLEELMTSLMEANKTYKDLYVQSDLLNNRVRNLESKLVKNSNISIAKIDTITKVIDSLKDIFIIKDSIDELLEMLEKQKPKTQSLKTDVKELDN